MISVFRRVGRYAPSIALDPRENRLTESFAAVLERVDGLAAELVSRLCGLSAPSEQGWVRTQRSTVGGNFVDLEIGFGPMAAPVLRIWVEIKHGADLHEFQLVNYRRDLSVEIQEDARLIVLAPRGAVDAADADASIAWQDVCAVMKRFARRSDLGAVERWLLNEFIVYLREEALTDEDALIPAHAFALAARPASDRVVERLIELAQGVVSKELGQPKDFLKRSGSKQPAYGVGWWASYPPNEPTQTAQDTWESAFLEWTCRADEFRAEPHDGIGFFVGVTFPKMQGSALAKPENAAWVAALGAIGFERVQAWFWRLWKPLYPEQLMAETSLADQAHLLGAWVVGAMRELRENPPPA